MKTTLTRPRPARFLEAMVSRRLTKLGTLLWLKRITALVIVLMAAFGATSAQAALPPLPVCDRPPVGQAGANDSLCRVELGVPPAGVPVKGMMLILAAGAWQSGPQIVDNFIGAGIPARWNGYGWYTWTVELTNGQQGFFDAVQQFDFLRAYFDQNPGIASLPVCVWGGSSGGHFALLVGAIRPNVGCVVTEAAPTNLGQLTGFGLQLLQNNLAIPPAAYAAWSPVTYPQLANMPVLLGHSQNDPVVPANQATQFRSSHPNSRVFLLPPAGPGQPGCVSDVVACFFISHQGDGSPIAASAIAQWRVCEQAMPTPFNVPGCPAQ
ncbi:MAG: alpha/beta hydrolase family protein [Nevskiales bacterium]